VGGRERGRGITKVCVTESCKADIDCLCRGYITAVFIPEVIIAADSVATDIVADIVAVIATVIVTIIAAAKGLVPGGEIPGGCGG
jgi:hypothetical protein